MHSFISITHVSKRFCCKVFWSTRIPVWHVN